ncbi:hypothetical protein EV06_1779 [Prochlorococcus sp. MIT 0602]|nr:hypothetical protein EV06_1779 [Prochlorococcus sp. MIT 0602]
MGLWSSRFFLEEWVLGGRPPYFQQRNRVASISLLRKGSLLKGSDLGSIDPRASYYVFK